MAESRVHRRSDDESGYRIRKRERVSNACQRCRKHKIKCSGTEPCKTCDNRGLRCEFDSGDKKVLISERALDQLKFKLSELEKQQAGPEHGHSSVDPPASSQADAGVDQNGPLANTMQTPQSLPRHVEPQTVERDFSPETVTSDIEHGVSNPLVPEEPPYFPDHSGRLLYMGHSSTWSFSRQVLLMAFKSPQSNHLTGPSVHVEGEAYNVDPEPPILSQADIAGLPSVDLSLYYVQNVKFRTQPLYCLFDETVFTARLHRFYENPIVFAQQWPIWYVHYLVIMAFGKTLSQGHSGHSPAGSQLFARALRLLPDNAYIVRDYEEAVEVLCCIGLYCQCIDHRSAAHTYIGQALRVAQSHGLHTGMQADVVGNEVANRCRRIWWTVYTLDRRVSSSMGVPNSIHDEDITAPLPLAISADLTSSGMIFHVKICQLLGKVVSTVYSTDGMLNKTYITTAQAVLRGIAGLADDLAVFSGRCFGEISRVVAHLNLAYHHCIILTSRPYLFYLLKQRLESSGSRPPFPLSSSAKGLVQVCIDSASQVVTVLSQLREHDLLDTFLPFDLESAFSAAFILLMASSVHPKLLPQTNWLRNIVDVFDAMGLKGYVLANVRKSEVEELAQALRVQDQTGFMNSMNTILPDVQIPPCTTSPMTDYASLPSLGDPFFDEWNADDGFSGAQIMNLADALNVGEFGDLQP